MKQSRRTFIEVLLTALLLISLATALARKPHPAGTAIADIAVVLNTKSLIYHCPVCELIRRCGTDCVTVNISEARRRGAKPCKACGGDCIAEK